MFSLTLDYNYFVISTLTIESFRSILNHLMVHLHTKCALNVDHLERRNLLFCLQLLIAQGKEKTEVDETVKCLLI